MKKSKSEIVFEYHQGLEFSNALFWGLFEEHVNKILEETKFNISDNDKKYVEGFRKNISPFIWREIRNFSNVIEFDILLVAFIEDYNLTDVDAIIDRMEKTDVEKFFRYIGGIYIFNNMQREHKNWDTVYEDMHLMKAFIEKNTEKSESQQILIECMENPEETKERIIFIIKNLYKKAFIPSEESILGKINEKKVDYENEARADFKEFKEKYFLVKDISKLPVDRFEFRVSFFQVAPFVEYSSEKKSKIAVVISTRAEEYLNIKEQEGQIQSFLKALSDNKKIRIIKMLSKEPQYGYGIADELNITPATVNYHVNILLGTGIIDIERNENRVYFSLNKENFRVMMRRAEKYLLDE